MSVEDRIELLKAANPALHQGPARIRHRRDPPARTRTKRLDRCWRSGWTRPPPAANCTPTAGNGVTGFVAATGKSYLCEDTTNDPLYLPALRRPQLAHRAADSARRDPGHVQRRKPRPGRLHRKRPAVPGALQPRSGRGAQHARTARRRKDDHRHRKHRIDPAGGRQSGRRNPERRRLDPREAYIGHDPNVAERLQRILSIRATSAS